MQKIFFVFPFLLLCTLAGKAQSLPPNTCGIVFAYDASGNRTQRAYVCNNSLQSAGKNAVSAYASQLNTGEKNLVSVLYPNPTTGQFRVYFTQPLEEAKIVLLDAGGRVMQQRLVSGGQVDLDISSFPAGGYTLRVQQGGSLFTYKVVKL